MSGNPESRLKAIIYDSLKFTPTFRKLDGQGKWHAPPRLKHRFSNGVIILFLWLFCLILPVLFPSLLAANLTVNITTDGTPVHLAHGVLKGEGNTYETFSQYGIADFGDSVSVAIGIEPIKINGFGLWQAGPNPGSRIGIKYAVPYDTEVSLKLYNLLGREVVTLVDGVVNSGEGIAMWNGTNNAGNGVADGIYFYRMAATNFSSSGKMAYVKNAGDFSGTVGKRLPGRFLGKSADGIRDVTYTLQFFNTDSTNPQIQDYFHAGGVDFSTDTTLDVEAQLRPQQEISGNLTEVPGMFGVGSAIVSLGQYTAISDSLGIYTLQTAITDTFRVTAMGFYSYAEPDVTAADGMQKDVQMIQQYTDPETGEDLWGFLSWSMGEDVPGGESFRWRDENLPIEVFINRTYLDTAQAYDIFDTLYGEGAYADSVWAGIQAWEDKVNEIATLMGADSLDLVREVDEDPEIGMIVNYDYGPAGEYNLLEWFDDAPKKGEIRIGGPPYTPVFIGNLKYLLAHELGHGLRFIEHGGLGVMGMYPKVSDFEARMCLLLYTIDNGTRMDFYTVPDAGKTSNSTSMTPIPQFE